MRFKLTRIEIIEMNKNELEYYFEGKNPVAELQELWTEDVLNSQDSIHELGDTGIQYTPKEMVVVRIEEVK